MEPAQVKKIIYTVLAVVALTVLGYIAYRYFSEVPKTRTQTDQTISGRPSTLNGRGGQGGERLTEEEKGTISGTIGRERQKLTQIADFAVIAPSFNRDKTKIYFYKKDGGDLFSSSFDGERQEKISNITVVNLFDAIWSRTGDRAAVFYLDEETKKGFLHIGTSTTAAIPQDTKSFSWSPDGRFMAYTIFKDEKTNLVVSDSSGKNGRTSFLTPIPDIQLNWVSPEKIAFLTAPSGLAEGLIFLYARSSGVFSKIIGPFWGLTSLWSPDGSRVLVSTTDSFGKDIELSIYDATGRALFSLSPVTLPEKCLWADVQSIFCAIPKTISAGAVWPDDYLRGELNTSDRILHFDLKNKQIQEIFQGGDYDISDLLISPNQEFLFFVNRVDGTLWSLRLK